MQELDNEDGSDSDVEDLDLDELERDIQQGGQIGECKVIFIWNAFGVDIAPTM